MRARVLFGLVICRGTRNFARRSFFESKFSNDNLRMTRVGLELDAPSRPSDDLVKDLKLLNVRRISAQNLALRLVLVLESRSDSSELDGVADPNEIVAVYKDARVELRVVEYARTRNALHVSRNNECCTLLGGPVCRNVPRPVHAHLQPPRHPLVPGFMSSAAIVT